MMPRRSIRFEQNFMPLSHAAGWRLRRVLAYTIPRRMPIINELKERALTASRVAMNHAATLMTAITAKPLTKFLSIIFLLFCILSGLE